MAIEQEIDIRIKQWIGDAVIQNIARQARVDELVRELAEAQQRITRDPLAEFQQNQQRTAEFQQNQQRTAEFQQNQQRAAEFQHNQQRANSPDAQQQGMQYGVNATASGNGKA